MQDMRSLRSLVFAVSTLIAAAPVSARAQDQAPPKGWLGVLITTGIGQPNESGALVFSDYPVIESIDPGSPAEKAGLMAGDILISINKQDFKRNPIPMNSLLVPGQKVIFRYRRNDVAKTSTLTVAERPAGTSARVQVSIIGPVPAPDAVQRARAEVLMKTRVNERAPLAPSMAIAPLVFGTGTPSIAIAGAELTQLNEGFRNALKVKGDGLLVINVALGSPAEEAGLASGDVIQRAEKQLLKNPGELYRLIELAQNNSILLQIVRNQKPRNVTLRW
jgi:serine protease Do